MVLLSADITFVTIDTAQIQFGGTGFINPPATTERQGVVELATWEEAAAGNRADVAVTPFGLLKALQSWATNFATAVHRHAISAIDGLPEALAGKSAVGHRHDASDTWSGVFDLGRIPSLPMEKIAGLAAALVLKANLGASVNFNDVRVTRGGRTGVLYFGDGDEFILLAGGELATNRPFNSPALTNAGNPVWHFGNFDPATKADLGANVGFALVRVGAGRALLYSDANTNNLLVRTGAEGQEKFFQHGDDGSFRALSGNVHSQHGRVWDPGNFNPATKASLNDSVTFADVRAYRGNGTGVIYLGDLAHYLFFDGVNYNLPGAPLIVNGGVVWTSATFDPASRVNKTGDTMTGPLRMPELRIKAPNTGKSGSYASVFSKYYGDDNYGVGFGGWRGDAGVGAWAEVGSVDQLGRGWLNGYRIWTAELFSPDTKANRDSPDFTGYPKLPGVTLFKKEFANSPEGGQFRLEKPDTGTTLGGHVVFDINGDNLRIFEEAEPYRGLTIPITALKGGVGSALWTSTSLKPASQAEAVAGAATDRFITPAALWSFARSIGSSGYAVIPGTGLMIQWGGISSTITEGFTHASLPVAFGGGCLVAMAIPRNAGGVVTADWYMQMGGKYQDRLVLYANRANGGTGSMDGYEWLALGRVSGTPDPAYSSGGGGGGGEGGGGGGEGGGGGGGGTYQPEI